MSIKAACENYVTLSNKLAPQIQQRKDLAQVLTNLTTAFSSQGIPLDPAKADHLASVYDELKAVTDRISQLMEQRQESEDEVKLFMSTLGNLNFYPYTAADGFTTVFYRMSTGITIDENEFRRKSNVASFFH